MTTFDFTRKTNRVAGVGGNLIVANDINELQEGLETLAEDGAGYAAEIATFDGTLDNIETLLEAIPTDVSEVAALRATFHTVLDWGTPTGLGADVTFINQAIDDIYDGGSGKGTLVFPDVATGYGVQRVGGLQASGILLKPGVSLHSENATFHMRGNNYFVWGQSPVDVNATITGDVAAGDLTLTVADTTGLVVGRPVMVRLNTNPVDTPEPQKTYYATIVSIDGTDVELDTAAPVAMSVSGTTEVHNRRIVQFDWLLENLSLTGRWNLVNAMGSGENAEGGISFQYARNIHIGAVNGYNTGSAVVGWQFGDGITVDYIYAEHVEAQSGHSAKGRAFGCSNSVGCRIGTIEAKYVERSVVFIESYSRDITIDRIIHHNSDATRDAGNNYLITVSGSADCRVRYARSSGLPCKTISGEGLRVDFLDLQMSDVPATFGARMGCVLNRIRIGTAEYGPRITRRKWVRLTDNMNGTNYEFNVAGVEAGARILISDKTGCTTWYWGKAGAQTTFAFTDITNGVAEAISNTENWGGTGYLFNEAGTAKRLSVYTGTITDGAYAVFERDYFPLISTTSTAISGDDVSAFIGVTGSQGAINADTSGASLTDLETEVNQIKATLRGLGIIAS